ncbi:hypothetical protein SINU_09975 [Sporolactobacillus inulinus CASD]|uniref:Uncharacterized protein n=1 Tax=Sporolactobacillus inulinus CASD TaxID=1069536 RepID=A0A0U1QMU4_9BACL|nr:hypothetical protein SINU_09975 [Sporolactobacillus inulinus CASD]
MSSSDESFMTGRSIVPLEKVGNYFNACKTLINPGNGGRGRKWMFVLMTTDIEEVQWYRSSIPAVLSKRSDARCAVLS